MSLPRRRYEEQGPPESGNDGAEEVADLNKRLEETNRKTDEYLTLAQHVQADFLNYKRRVEEERAEQARQSQSRLILRLLPVLDDLERAMDSVKAELAGLHWVQGIGQINRKLRNVLEAEGLEPIEALGQEFDPRYHEAVVFADSRPEDAHKVLAVLQPGYKLHDRVIRPAMVKVGKGSPAHRASQGERNNWANSFEEDNNA